MKKAISAFNKKKNSMIRRTDLETKMEMLKLEFNKKFVQKICVHTRVPFVNKLKRFWRRAHGRGDLVR